MMAPSATTHGHGAPSHPVHVGSVRLLGACSASCFPAMALAVRSSEDIPRYVSLEYALVHGTTVEAADLLDRALELINEICPVQPQG